MWQGRYNHVDAAAHVSTMMMDNLVSDLNKKDVETRMPTECVSIMLHHGSIAALSHLKITCNPVVELFQGPDTTKPRFH